MLDNMVKICYTPKVKSVAFKINLRVTHKNQIRKKMKTTISLLAAALVSLFSSGCLNLNSGNVASGIKPPPYKQDENAVTLKMMHHIDKNGGITTDSEETRITGLEVAREFKLRQLEVARDVGIAQARSGFSAFDFSGGAANFYGNNGANFYGEGVNTTGGGYVTPYGGGSGYGGNFGGGVSPYVGGGNSGGNFGGSVTPYHR